MVGALLMAVQPTVTIMRLDTEQVKALFGTVANVVRAIVPAINTALEPVGRLAEALNAVAVELKRYNDAAADVQMITVNEHVGGYPPAPSRQPYIR